MKNKSIAEKVQPESETRKKVLGLAMAKGPSCYMQAVFIMDKYDKLLRNCTNEVERNQMGAMGIAEINALLSCNDELYIEDRIIIPK